jgi:hypothetical protein
MKKRSLVSFNSHAWLSQEQVLALPDGTELIEGAHNGIIILTEAVRMHINIVFSEAHGLVRLNHNL